jgi:hypothetical protein
LAGGAISWLLVAVTGCGVDKASAPQAPTALVDGVQPTAVGQLVENDSSTREPSREALVTDAMAEGANQLQAASSYALAKFGPASSDSLAAWNRALDRVAKRSKRGAESVALSRQVLLALAATTREEFHNRVSALPVTFAEVAGSDSSGRAGVHRQYYVNGKATARIFLPDGPTTPRGGDAEEFLQLEGEDEVAVVRVAEASPFSTATAATFDWCEDYDEDFGYYEGECATEQDFDDLTMALVAYDSDIDGMQQDVTADSVAYCLANQDDVEFCADQNVAVNSNNADWSDIGAATAIADYEDGPLDGAPQWQVYTALIAAPSDATAFCESCLADYVVAAATTYGYFNSRLRVLRLLQKTWALVPYGKVADAMIELTLMFTAAGVSFSSLADCLNEQ